MWAFKCLEFAISVKLIKTETWNFAWQIRIIYKSSLKEININLII